MSEPNEEKAPSLGLSDQERNNMIVSFIKAFVDGKVKLEIPEADELTGELLRAMTAQYGEDYTRVDPAQLAMVLKAEVQKRIEIVAGNVNASPQERKEAINYLFGIIVSLRMVDRIRGEFIGVATFESRLKDAEEKLARLSALMEDLQMMLRVGLGLSGGRQRP